MNLSSTESLAVWLIGCLLLGLLVGWALASMRAHQRTQAEILLMAERQKAAQQQAVDSAVAAVRAGADVELATLRERLLGLDQTRDAALAELGQTKTRADALRDALDIARDERAQLSERAARLPEFEASVAQFSARLTETSEALNAAQSRCAALEADNARIAPLADKLEATAQEHTQLNGRLGNLREDAGRLQAELGARQAEVEALRGSERVLKQAQTDTRAELGALQVRHAELSAQLDAERSNSAEKLATLLDAKEALSLQFKSLASDILEEKSKRFAEQNELALGQMLNPLKTRLQEFQGKVELFYDTEGKQRSALTEQVAQLLGLNKTLSDDAKNLTSALKGSVKTQGNWGELILERVLEASGLRKGTEYDVQTSHTREDGSRAQPDVVIHLPESRHLVVDAKVSLVAYEQFANETDDIARAQALRRHLDSVRAHIKGLSVRNYQELHGIESLDFVLLFIPIEPAFMAAAQGDNELFMEAWNKNVLLVSPSTLLFVVRTVAHLWRQEAQSRNAQEIAKRGAELFDRLSAFVTDLERVGKNLEQAQIAYTSAFDKLSKNKGNVIRQAEMLVELGVKPTKALPASRGDSE